MIHILQKKIEKIYRLSSCPEAQQYVLSPKQFKKLAKSSNNPQVIYQDEGDDMSLGIYLGSNLFKRIKQKSRIFSFQDFCVMSEEISHFIYLIWSKSNGKTINLLDLEVQAEVDKFVLASDFFGSKKQIFQKMFKNFNMRQNLREDEQERYYTANRLGKKFALSMLSEKVTPLKKMNWLRMFYRQNINNRILMIEKGFQ
ncbi:MAG: hypothetical protein IT286_04865 [Proteobacteria bacterium]|jgi:hypothetical protein|nr:hypothetical protein [Pseudomonadota bacterium]